MMLIAFGASILPVERWRASRTVPHAPAPRGSSTSSCASVSVENSPRPSGVVEMPPHRMQKPCEEKVPVSERLNVSFSLSPSAGEVSFEVAFDEAEAE